MRVAVIGLGIMGTALATKLMAGGHQLSVFNRTKAKADPLLATGATWCESPAAAAAASDIAMTFVTDETALETLAFGDNGVFAGLGADAIHCDMSTIAPVAAAHVAERYRAAGKHYIQSPVLGSKKQIQDTALLVLAGGSEADVARCRELYASFAKRVWYFETAEQSAATKLACNTLIAQMIVGLGQTMAIAGAAGVGPATVLDIVGESALASSMYASKGKAIVEGDFTPNFIVRNLLKDLRLAGEYADDKALPLPANAVARELFIQAVAAGFGEEDYSAVVKTILSRG